MAAKVNEQGVGWAAAGWILSPTHTAWLAVMYLSHIDSPTAHLTQALSPLFN
jgi:hypothetical protein